MHDHSAGDKSMFPVRQLSDKGDFARAGIAFVCMESDPDIMVRMPFSDTL